MGKPGFVRNAQDDSEHPEIGMPCSRTSPHTQHAWQMSATGWCLCLGVETEPIFQRLIREHTVQHGHALMVAGLFEYGHPEFRIISDLH